MRLRAVFAFATYGLMASAADHSLAGAWKFNIAKSVGPAPSCMQDGILTIQAEVYTGSPKQDKDGRAAHSPKTAKCNTVYLFTPSPDGRTLTLTPQANPNFKSVFDKQ